MYIYELFCRLEYSCITCTNHFRVEVKCVSGLSKRRGMESFENWKRKRETERRIKRPREKGKERKISTPDAHAGSVFTLKNFLPTGQRKSRNSRLTYCNKFAYLHGDLISYFFVIIFLSPFPAERLSRLRNLYFRDGIEYLTNRFESLTVGIADHYEMLQVVTIVFPSSFHFTNIVSNCSLSW